MKIIKFALAFVLIATSFVNISAEDKKTFKVGLIVCLTGACANWGKNSLDGVKIAVDELNKKGGVLGLPVEIVVEDTQENENKMKTVNAFNQLLGRGDIHYFIGPTWSEAGSILIPTIKRRSDVVVISPTLGVADFNEAAPNIFNTMMHSVTGTRKIARFAREKGFKKAAVFSTQQTWCIEQAKVFEDEFKKNGGEITFVVETTPAANDIRTEVLKTIESKPDMVFATDMSAAVQAPRELKRAGYKGQIMTPLLDDEMAEKNGEGLNGAYYFSDFSPSGEFVKKFEKAYGVPPNTGSDSAYNAMMAIANGIEKAKSFDAKLAQEEILKSEFQGANGTVKFDKDGGIIQEPDIYQFVDGKRIKSGG